MRPKIIKVSEFADGTYTIKAPPAPQLAVTELLAEGEEALLGELEPAVDPRVVAAEQEADAIVARARAEAEALLAEAESGVAALRDQALEEGRREGHAEGLARGRAEGREEALAEHAARLSQLGEAIAAFDRMRAEREEAHAQDLAKLAVLIAQKILAVELGHGREAAAALARTALKRITDKSQVRLRVHPLDVEAILATKQQLITSVDGLSQLDVVGDPQVGLGGCLVETRSGMVDARLSTQLSEIAAALLDVRAGLDEAGEMDPVVAAAIRALRGTLPATEQPQPARPVLEPRRPARRSEPARPDPAAEAEERAKAMLEAAQREAEQLLARAKAEAEAAARMTAAASEAPERLDAAASHVVEAPGPSAMAAATEIEPVAAEAGAREPGVSREAEPGEGRQAPRPPAGAEPRPQGGPPQPEVDPSRRAAQALAARLGQAKAGRAVLSLEEELELKRLQEGRHDAELEQIIKQTQLPRTDIGLDQSLVWTPPTLEDAADALAARLGQKPRSRRDEPAGTLAGDQLDAVLEGVGLRPEIAPGEAEPAEEPNIEKATDALAKMLGKKRKKSNRPWYEQLE